jgi:hypothetical protein
VQVLQCGSGQPSQMFTLPGTETLSGLAATPDGSAALLTDIHGKVWMWVGSNVV